MTRRSVVAAGLALLTARAASPANGTPAAAAERAGEGGYTSELFVEDCRPRSRGDNRFFPLWPGDQWTLEGTEGGHEARVVITVLHELQPITFRTARGGPLSTTARVVEEREWIDDRLVEVSRNFFVACDRTGDVLYLGEDVEIHREGEVISRHGEWRAGRSGARPGLIMPGTFLLGARYYQEMAPGAALDRAEHVAEGLRVKVPAGVFESCVEILETNPLEPGDRSTKTFCPGVGLVRDEGLELTDYRLRRREGTSRE